MVQSGGKILWLKADESGHLPFDAEALSERKRYSKLLLKLIGRWRDAQVGRGKEGDSDQIASIKEELEELRHIVKEASVQVTRV